MSKSTPPLEQAFNHALSNGGNSPGDVENLQRCLKFYHQHQRVIDAAVGSAQDFLESPEGAAYVKALAASLDGAEANRLSVKLASEIRDSAEFSRVSGLSNVEVQGLGLGASGGASVVFGGIGGADFIFEVTGKGEVHPRTWYGFSLKTGLSINLGLELSLWFNKPFTTAIKGYILDLYAPQPFGLLFIRCLFIEQEQNTSDFTFSAVSLQFPLGVGLPVRLFLTRLPVAAVFGAFDAAQQVWVVSKRSSLKIINKATKVDAIYVDTTAALAVTYTNTSDQDFTLSPNATMTLTMPAYFTDDDVANMKINLEGWELSADGTDLKLTLLADYQWKSGTAILFDINDVRSSNKPPLDQASVEGRVKLVLDDVSFRVPLSDTDELFLAWGTTEGTFQWQVTLSEEFTLNGEGSGTTVAFAQPGDDVRQLTTATHNETGDVWILGYIFNYNTDFGTAFPQVRAAWLQQGAFRIPGQTLYLGGPADDSGETSTAYYKGSDRSGSSIAITVNFSAET